MSVQDSINKGDGNRFLRFAAARVLQVLVNTGVLWLLVKFTELPFYLCAFLAIETSILINFMLKDKGTLRVRRKSSFGLRLLRYHRSTAFSLIFINITVLMLLKEWVGLWYLWANLAGIGCGMIFYFLRNSHWTYSTFSVRLPAPGWMITGIFLAVRLGFAAGLGPGFDEAYYFAYSVNPSLSYFDHPPMVGFLAGFFPYLLDHVSPFTIRLAAVLLFTLSGVLLYQFAREFSSQKIALWALFLFNITPIFMLGAGIFILPDAGLVIFWVLTLIVFHKIIFNEPAWADWLLAGITTGMAMLSKYHGLLLGFFLVVYLLLYKRRAFSTMGPYLYGIVAFAVFSPVLIWNARHEWVSFVFQGSRAVSEGLRLDAFGQAIGGQLGYLTPMVFIPMALVMGRLLWRYGEHRFMVFFGVLPVLLFLAISLSRPILPHWTLVGYIVLTIPLAQVIGTSYDSKRWVRTVVTASVVFLVVLLGTAYAQVNYGILRLDKMAGRGWITPKAARKDATLDMHGWEALGDYLKKLPADSVFLFTHKWFLSGEVELAVDGSVEVLCFNENDPRGYGVWDKSVDVLGKDGLAIHTNRYRVNPDEQYSDYFLEIGKTDSIIVERGGVPAKTFYITPCKQLLRMYEAPF